MGIIIRFAMLITQKSHDLRHGFIDAWEHQNRHATPVNEHMGAGDCAHILERSLHS